jgi:hypothetical protein
LGFDPLGLKPTDAAAFEALQTKELQNGRLALLGVAGIVAQELVFFFFLFFFFIKNRYFFFYMFSTIFILSQLLFNLKILFKKKVNGKGVFENFSS